MIALDGCRHQPLGSYLQGLGAWRVLSRLGDHDVRACWRDGRLLLDTALDLDGVISAIYRGFEPLPVVSPWNSGSGFAANGKSRSAEQLLERVRSSTEPRLAALREVVDAADHVVTLGRARGWTSTTAGLWDERRKADVLRLCRNTLPDDALPWLDAAVVLVRSEDGVETPAYNRLLGTGGNFGRQDLQTTYLQRVFTIFDPRRSANSEAWLRAALTGDESTPYLREAVGQFDPGRAGGVQSSPAEKSDEGGFANPWSFLLTIEGAVLFASAAARRQGATTSGLAVPFVFASSPIGYGSSADDENATAEIWTPEWAQPATLAEIEHLLGEGRIEWNGRPARSGLDAARAIATLGVDRGITRFTRSVFAERLGQSPLAVPVATVAVRERPGVALLAGLDSWLARVRRTRPDLPQPVATRMRQLERAMYSVAVDGASAALAEVLAAAGRLHAVISRSGRCRAQVAPLVLAEPVQWLDAIGHVGPELRLATALASGRDNKRDRCGGLRPLLTPITAGARISWTDRSAPAAGASIIDALAAAHRLRARPGAVPVPDSADAVCAPSVRGVFSAFHRGLHTTAGDVAEMLGGRIDLDLLGDYLAALLLFDWSNVPPGDAAPHDGSQAAPLPVELALLLPFYAPTPLSLPQRGGQAPSELTLRPGAEWLPRLHAGAVDAVLADATSRLRIAGFRDLAPAPPSRHVDPDRLSAALLVPVVRGHRIRALQQVAFLTDPPRPHTNREAEGALA